MLAGFVLFFQGDNPQFDAARFVKAAGMAGTDAGDLWA